MSNSTPRLLQLQELLKESPSDSFLLFAIAKEYEGLDKLESALSNYLLLKKHDPKYTGLYYHLGKLHELLDEEEQAMVIYQEGIDHCIAVGDQHALNELKGAKVNLEMLS